MSLTVDDATFAQLCADNDFNVPEIMKVLRKQYPNYSTRRDRVTARILSLRKKGVLPLDSGNYVSGGELLTGTSTLYDHKGDIKLQWVKTDVEKESALETFKICIEEYVKELPQFAPYAYSKTYVTQDLMAIYPLGDPHIGMKAYKDEAGDNWNLKTAQKVFCSIFDRLVKTTPPCAQGVIVNLGDYFHRDNMAGVTERNKHKLDTDGTYLMMVDTGLKIMLQMINSALEHHQTVKVINTLGNHDDTGTIFMQTALKHMYQNEPRVYIDCTQSLFQYFQHGNSFFGVHHGHTTKPDKLPLVMATDRPKEWGDSKHRYFLTGHIHHDTRKEYSGCIVESFRTLASRDAYAQNGGYRSGQDSKALVIHKDYGEVERHTINIAQVLV